MGLGKTLLLAASLLASAAHAASDKVATGPAPSWVKPVALPAAGEDEQAEAPIQVLLADQQSRLEPGRVTTYVDVAMKIQTPQGLAAGNLSFPWNPQTDDITVHKLVIHRDGEMIDVLADGQTFTVLRREPNLESATLDGVLTANIQPEGLQVGDVLEYAMTVSSSDPVLKGHVEQGGAMWNGVPFARANLSVEWPSDMAVRWRQSGELPQVKPVKSGGTTRIALSLEDLQPVIPPRGAPDRFAMGRMIEFSDFGSWAEVGTIMAPLYDEAAVIPAEGALRNEVEKIRAASDDPVKRAEAALALVQDRVRYVALLMGTGGLVPASAEETWARRYGDCKAKTALLLAILGELGIEAEPVAVNALSGDGIDERLPMIGLFNHVIVRAHVGGQPYWMDGTRTGDTSLARLKTPYFSWGLPLVAQNAALVRMVPDPLDRPEKEILIDIDASDGLTLPAPTKATMILRNDSALGTKIGLAQLTAAQRDEVLRRLWREQFDQLDAQTVAARYDEATGEEILTAEGVTNMEWDGGWFYPSRVGLAYDPDFTRPQGTNRDAPYANDYPEHLFTRFTVKFPPGTSTDQKLSEDAVNETVAGTSYVRTVSFADNVYTVEATTRALAPEFPANEAAAAQKALKAISDNRVALRWPTNTPQTTAELEKALSVEPSDAAGFATQGFMLARANRLEEARPQLEKALALDPGMEIVRYTLAGILVRQGEFDGALEQVSSIDISQVKSPELAQLMGVLYTQAGDWKRALPALDRHVALTPGKAAALAMRAQAKYNFGNRDEALVDAADALKFDPKLVGAHQLRANIFRNRGLKAEALAEVAAAELALPDDVDAHVIAGKFYGAYGEIDKGMAAFDRALAVGKQAYIYVNRAEIRPEADVAGQLSDYDLALEIEPDMPEALIGKAKLQAASGDNAGAVKTYSIALEKDADQPDILNRRGLIYLGLGEAENAEADFAAARNLADSAGVLNNICFAKAVAGLALEAALAECTEALKKQPDAAAILDSRALVLLRMGRLDDAIADYDAALAKYPTLAASLYGRSIAWSRKGEQDKAQADLAAALQADADVQKQFEDYGVTQ